jgi:hypothetical protein
MLRPIASIISGDDFVSAPAARGVAPRQEQSRTLAINALVPFL